VSRPALGYTRGSYTMDVRSSFPWGKAAEAWNWPLPSSAEVKNVWSYTCTPPIRLHGVVLIIKKYRDNFTFTLTCLLVMNARAFLKQWKYNASTKRILT
jgi:hypothetical protein